VGFASSNFNVEDAKGPLLQGNMETIKIKLPPSSSGMKSLQAHLNLVYGGSNAARNVGNFHRFCTVRYPQQCGINTGNCENCEVQYPEVTVETLGCEEALSLCFGLLYLISCIRER
jgi:hypothetical protein